jgi:D-sedoheptulose 7-phosphate isomerase
MSDAHIAAGLRALARLAEATTALAGQAEAIAQRYLQTLRGGGTIYFAGNGGSAADAQHLATEFVVRYARTRRALAAVALTTDTSLLLAAGNDLGFEQVFSRQVEAHCRPGDLLVLHSTSGASPNLLRAAEAARARGVPVVAFLGKGGGALAGLVDQAFVVAAEETSHIQEIHLAVEHLIVDVVEQELDRG